MQIEQLYKADRAAWITPSQGLHDAAMNAVKAADSKNVEALLGAGEGIDTACENCHKKAILGIPSRRSRPRHEPPHP